MSRILLILVLISVGGYAEPAADGETDRFRAYFKQLDLPYVEPRGCGIAAPCEIAADFNDDGVNDFAALYEYTGPTSRRNGWTLDLVIIYSHEGSSELKHAVYTHVGQIDNKSQTIASLALQRPGPIKIAAGDLNLERPAINIIAARNTDQSQFVTFYWRDKGFYSIDKSDD